jgi:Fic family protein
MTREYEKTHKWITFSLNLNQAPYDLWVALGEAQSKCEHISGTPLKPTIAQELHNIFMAKGVMATTAIEGNTLSEDEVRRRIEGKLELPPSREYLGVEVDNVVKALNAIGDQVIKEDRAGVSVAEICEFNRQVLEGLTLEDDVIPGKIRTYSVGVGRYRGAPAQDCEYLLERLCDWLSTSFEPPKGMEIVFGIVRAVVAHVYFAWIHPFGDGNGRTARLIEFKALLESGVPTPAAHLLSNHYNKTRTEYYRRLEHASRSGGDLFPFLSYAVKGYVDGLRDQVEMIRGEQVGVSWTNFVHDKFRDKRSGGAFDRQKRVVLDLSQRTDPVPFDKIRELSPKVAESYAGKTPKTVTRDLNALIDMELVGRGKAGYFARIERILAFFPARRTISAK